MVLVCPFCLKKYKDYKYYVKHKKRHREMNALKDAIAHGVNDLPSNDGGTGEEEVIFLPNNDKGEKGDKEITTDNVTSPVLQKTSGTDNESIKEKSIGM